MKPDQAPSNPDFQERGRASRRRGQQPCSRPGCDAPVSGRSLCNRHYKQAQAAGGLPPRKRDKPYPERFAEHIKRDEATGCLNWIRSLDSAGYGLFWVEGRHQKAHRWAWEQARGPISPDRQLDHLCRNRRCCEVTHLEPVTVAENILRGECHAARNARKTHCYRGHEFTPENTIRTSSGGRRCRICKNEAARAARRMSQGKREATGDGS